MIFVGMLHIDFLNVRTKSFFYCIAEISDVELLCSFFFRQERITKLVEEGTYRHRTRIKVLAMKKNKCNHQNLLKCAFNFAPKPCGACFEDCTDSTFSNAFFFSPSKDILLASGLCKHRKSEWLIKGPIAYMRYCTRERKVLFPFRTACICITDNSTSQTEVVFLENEYIPRTKILSF